MFGFQSSHAAPSALRASVADLSRRAPYRDETPSALARLAESASLEVLRAGPLPAKWFDGAAVFLNSGEIELRSANGQRVFLSSVSPPAQFPLPDPHKVQMRCVEPATFVRVPAAAASAATSPDTSFTAATDPRLATLRGVLEQRLASGEIPLPSMPDLAIRLNAAMRSPDSAPNDHDIAKLIQLDPALASKVIHVVNSAAFRFARRASTVQQAVTRLGRERIRTVAVGFLLRHAFHTDSAALRQRAQELWRRSCHVAAVCFTLARQLPTIDPERAMLAGLVHRIGGLPVLGLANRDPGLFTEPQLLDAATQVFEKPLGRMVLERWSFDAEMLEAVAQAGNWTRIGHALPDCADVVVLAQLHADMGRPGANRRPPLHTVPAFQKLELGRLTPNRSIQALEDAEQEIAELRRILSRTG